MKKSLMINVFLCDSDPKSISAGVEPIHCRSSGDESIITNDFAPLFIADSPGKDEINRR